ELVEELLGDRQRPTLRSFDVNYRPALHGNGSADLLRTLARQADVVFCGLDEAQALWGAGSVEEVRDLLTGPDLVVVKQGSDGATPFRGDGGWDNPAPPVDVADPVGAGDAFAAGVLDRLLAGAAIVECLGSGAGL